MICLLGSDGETQHSDELCNGFAGVLKTRTAELGLSRIYLCSLLLIFLNLNTSDRPNTESI